MTPAQVHLANPLLKIPRRRWGIALLLGFGVLVNYFDRVTFPSRAMRCKMHSEFPP